MDAPALAGGALRLEPHMMRFELYFESLVRGTFAPLPFLQPLLEQGQFRVALLCTRHKGSGGGAVALSVVGVARELGNAG